jgi:CBS domain-containing protein
VRRTTPSTAQGGARGWLTLEEPDTFTESHPEATLGAADTTTRTAREIMHPGAECVSESDSLLSVAQRMRDLGVGSMPLCGADDRLHGIITDRDVTIRCVAEDRDPATPRAADLARNLGEVHLEEFVEKVYGGA